MWTKVGKLYEENYKNWDKSLPYSPFLKNEDIYKLIENSTDEEINELNLINRNILFHAIYGLWDLDVCELIINRMDPKILSHPDSSSLSPISIDSRKGFSAIECQHGTNMTILHYALLRERIDLFKILLDKMDKESIFVKDKNGCTVLHVAAYYGYIEVCKLLYDKYPELLYVVNLSDNTCLHEAVFVFKTKVCEYLLSIDPNLSSYVNKNQETPLLLAVGRNLFPNENLNNTCKVLINSMNSESLNYKDQNNKTALDIANKSSNTKEIAEMLKNLGVEECGQN